MARNKSIKSKPSTATKGVRSFWSGTISFALVNVPVDLFPANRNTSVAFRLLSPEGNPLQRRYFCPEDQVDVHPEHLLRGFPIDDDEYVIVRDEELEAAEPRKSREIDLRRFVKLQEISPLLFHRSYYLTPRGDTNKAYRLLAQVMEETDRAGIATFVMRDREYLIAITAQQGILRAATLRFADEVRDAADVGLPEQTQTDKQSVQRLQRMIDHHRNEQLDSQWLIDHYSQRLRQAAEEKRSTEGTTAVSPQEDSQESTPDEQPKRDLLETIRQSLAQSASPSDGTDGLKESSTNGKSTGRQVSHKKVDATEMSNGRSPAGGLHGRHLRSDAKKTQTSATESRPDRKLQDKSKQELYELAKQYDIHGRSRMSKSQLVKQLRQRRR